MAKYKAENVQFWAGGYDLAADTRRVGIEVAVAVLDPTALSDVAERTLSGIRRGSFEHTGMLDDAAGQSNAALAALLNTVPVVTVAPMGNTQGKRAVSGLVVALGFKGSGPLNDVLLQQLQGQTDGRVEIAKVLQVKVTKTVSFGPVGYDDGAASSAGAVGFLHVFAANGTADVTIEESSDNGSGDPWLTLVTFAQFSALGSQRVAVTGAVERYVRARLVLGTATSVTYAVTWARL